MEAICYRCKDAILGDDEDAIQSEGWGRLNLEGKWQWLCEDCWEEYHIEQDEADDDGWKGEDEGD
jgi:hypothetical protein